MSRQYYNNKISMKRIRAELKQLRSNPNPMFKAEPTEEDMFHWRFAIRGTPDSSFEGGIYYGRIMLPTDYPLKAPNIIILTPNGRFSIGQKICLNVSAYHPEEWHPAWTVRTILEALIIFMPTSGEGAIGSIDWTEAERKNLAKQSHIYNKTKGFTKWFQLEAVDMGKQRAAQKEFSDQARQAHVHTIESKNVQNNDTTAKIPQNNGVATTTSTTTKATSTATTATSTATKASPAPKPSHSQAPRSATTTRQPPPLKKINPGPAVKRTELQQASDPMLYVAVAVLVMFLAFVYKLFLT